MNNKVPTDQQVVEVLVGDDAWQQATYKDGEFVDTYGMPLERSSISDWRPHVLAPANSNSAASANHA
jgi:hypothetical protein